jgi:RNA polymerase sigma-54 factor
LTVSTEEIAKSYDRPITVAKVEEVLRMVQRLDPPGVGARDNKECLLLQLTPETPHRKVLRVLIMNHLGRHRPQRPTGHPAPDRF